MGRAVVVVESMFGNTEEVAQAIAAGIAAAMPVEVVPVGEAPSSFGEDVGLLVVGGPTHAFGMSRGPTRVSAVDQGARPTGGAGPGIRDWLGTLGRARPGIAAAAFDTRIRKRGVPGSAARGAERRLRHLRYAVVLPARSFWVEGTSGPLLPGELDKARAWGGRLAGLAPTSAPLRDGGHP